MNTDAITTFYSSGGEKDRLTLDIFRLEGLRTKEIILRFLTRQALNILDVGGGAGFYAFWLTRLGHNVSLVDLSPTNIELADEYAKQHQLLLQHCEIGDATSLNFPDDQFDIVLLLGPLYHLTEEKERIKALTEAKRVLKSGGILLAAVISRYASLIDGLKRNLINDDHFEKILINDLQTGIHLNETGHPEYFTTAFFHTPVQIKNEIIKSDLKFEKLVAIESVGWIVDDFDEISKNERYMNKIQGIVNIVESNEDLISMSPHIMAIARKLAN
jgi:ubiquinone/menaquinone biosynthesis C-methylase UbiE